MKDNHDFQPGEMDLPEGWSPEAENDPRWRRIAELAREAGAPPAVPPARFDAMKLELQRQLREEGILRTDVAPRSNQSFGAWLQSLLFGGGWGGQLVRFGAVGAIAFMAGQSPDVTPKATTAVAVSEPEPASDPKVVASLPTQPTNTAKVTSVSDTPIQGFAIERGIKAPRSGGNLTWTSTAPSDGPTVGYGAAGAVPVSTAAVQPSSSVDGRNLAAEAFDQLQVVKFYSIVQQDERQLAEIRRVEQLLSQMVGSDGGGATSPEAQGQEYYRAADQLLAAGRYGEAISVYERAAAATPDSPVGFLARFQIGRIAFEYTRDYTLAQESFKACRDNYPSYFANSRYQAFLDEHLKVLEQTAGDNWESLRTWQNAKVSATPEEALDLLVKVVAKSESPVLAVDAADRIREILLTDLAFPPETIEQALETLDNRVRTGSADASTARIQFNRAEITSRRRPGDLSSVAAEYSRVLQLAPDENVERAARIRLNLIQSRLAPQP